MMTQYDPRSQRSVDEVGTLHLGPASELIVDDMEASEIDEHRMGKGTERLEQVEDRLTCKLNEGAQLLEELAAVLDDVEA